MLNTLLLISLGLLILVGIGAILVRIRRSEHDFRLPENIARLEERIALLNEKSGDMSRQLDSKLQETNRMMQAQFGQSAQIVRDVTERLTKLDETNRQVLNFSEQLRQLQDILKNPKQRGVLGEYFLETLLKNIMPAGSYQMQYHFSDGEIVDAVIRVKDKLVPVDAKFSLDNYNRIVESREGQDRDRFEKLFVNDLKTRIQETAKYIRPNEGTTDFAFMFIPHEAIYYDLLVNKIGALVTEDTENLIQRAAGKYKVLIVSPTNFLAYLQTVLQGLKALHIEESALEIRKNVEKLSKHLDAYETHFVKVGERLASASTAYEAASKEFGKIDKDVVRIADSSASEKRKGISAHEI